MAGRMASSSTLGRLRKKREFESALGGLLTRLGESNERVERLSNQLAEAQRELAQAETDAREARVRLGELQETERQAGLEAESAQRQLEWQKNQLIPLQAEVGESESIQQRISESQVEVEVGLIEFQTQLKDISAKLNELAADELQEQVSYWITRAAVAEQSVGSAIVRKEERAKEIMRLDSRRVELVARLRESEHALNGLDNEKARLRENETALHGRIEEVRC